MKKDKLPLVSVVMPVYGGEEFLHDSISSILDQTYQNIEFIIINDKSPDNSHQIIDKFAHRDKRIVVINNKTNQGQSPSANIGYRASTGKYVARMDQDDIALPQRIEKQVKFMELHPDYFLVGTQAEIIGINGEKIGIKNYPISHQEVKNSFWKFLPLCHPSIIVRKSLVETPDRLWFEEGDPIPDTYTFFYYISRAKFANLPEVLMKYRVHEDNGSYQNIKAIFNQTIRYRLKAIREWNYPFHLYYIPYWLLQALPVYLLPNKVVMNLFLLVRGIKKWTDYLP